MPDDAGLSRITGIIRHRRCEGISPPKGGIPQSDISFPSVRAIRDHSTLSGISPDSQKETDRCEPRTPKPANDPKSRAGDRGVMASDSAGENCCCLFLCCSRSLSKNCTVTLVSGV